MKIDWEKMNGLIPVVIQDFKTDEVLMLAYMNEEALKLSQSTKIAHYFSRSRKRIWKKGETSGHIQHIKELLIDCDNDTLLLKVEQVGVACHTGRKSCFFTNLDDQKEVYKVEVDTTNIYNVTQRLYEIICSKKLDDPTKSYSAKLLQGEENSLLKKIIEESSELCFAIKDNNEKEIIYESADLIYHFLVALASKNISPSRVNEELERRFNLSGIEEKNSRTNK